VRLAWTVPRWLVRREFLVTVKDLSGPLPPLARGTDVAWRRLAAAEIPRLLAESPTLTETEVWRRLREGQECWVGWAGDIPAHWRWETSVEAYFPYLHRGVRPLDGDRWIVDVYTHPSRRRRGLYAAATVAAMHRAREQGHRRLIGLIAAWNASARRVAEGTPALGHRDRGVLDDRTLAPARREGAGAPRRSGARVRASRGGRPPTRTRG
jgi:GNAT superfamily N-acetyltransferase